MKRLLIAIVVLVLVLFVSLHFDKEKETVSFGRFGTLTLYHSSRHPSHLVLFVSGEAGWNDTVDAIARSLSSLDTLVVGIDLPHYLRELAGADEWCVYLGGDFDALSKFIQKSFAFPAYEQPVMVGYEAGATVVYATLAQAPPDIFRGAISLNFCPRLSSKKLLCEWHNLTWQPNQQGDVYQFLPAATLSAPWIVLQGSRDEACEAVAVERYVKQTEHAKFIRLTENDPEFLRVAHGKSQLQNMLLSLFETPEAFHVSQDEMVKDLPVVEISTSSLGGDTLAVVLSGDGGWASIDRNVGEALAGRGVAVVGLNTLKYFWTPRTPEEAARDLERTLRYYLAAWKKDHVVLIGYSLGADVLPFLINRLSPETRSRVRLVALLGPAHTANFEFHVSDWLWDSSPDDGQPTLPEAEKLQGPEILCFYGAEENDSLCPDLNPRTVQVTRLNGGHHFDGDYHTIVERILRDIGQPTDTPNKP